MKISSAKNKGRRAQQEVVNTILEYFPELTKDDVRSRSMGAPGADIMLSKVAKTALSHFVFEVKNQEVSKVIYDYFNQASHNARLEHGLPIVCVKRNRSKMLAVISFEVFIGMLQIMNAYYKTHVEKDSIEEAIKKV